MGVKVELCVGYQGAVQAEDYDALYQCYVSSVVRRAESDRIPEGLEEVRSPILARCVFTNLVGMVL